MNSPGRGQTDGQHSGNSSPEQTIYNPRLGSSAHVGASLGPSTSSSSSISTPRPHHLPPPPLRASLDDLSTSSYHTTSTKELRLDDYPAEASNQPANGHYATSSSSTTVYEGYYPTSSASTSSSISSSSSPKASVPSSSAASTAISIDSAGPDYDMAMLDDKILHFTSTLAAAASEAGADCKKEHNIDDLQRKLHFYQVMLWLKRSYRLGGETSLTKRCVYQDYSNMCTNSGTPCLFSPSVFGKVIKRTFPDLKYRRRRINRRINAHYDGLERVREYFDASGQPRVVPIKQEEREEAERLRLEFQDKKIGGRQGGGGKPKNGEAQSSPATAKRSRKTVVKKEVKRGSDDSDYVPEGESDGAHGSHPEDDDDNEAEEDDGVGRPKRQRQAPDGIHSLQAGDHAFGGGGGGHGHGPLPDPFWRDWTLPADGYYVAGDRPGSQPGPPPPLPHLPPYDYATGPHGEPASSHYGGGFTPAPFLDSGPPALAMSYSSSTTSAVWRPPPLPSHAFLSSPSPYGLPSSSSSGFPSSSSHHHPPPSTLPTHPSAGSSSLQSRYLPSPPSFHHSSSPASSSSSSPSAHASLPSFPLPSSFAPSPSAFPPTSSSSSSTGNHPCPCPSCLSGRPYYDAPFHP